MIQPTNHQPNGGALPEIATGEFCAESAGEGAEE
jgi:hypothetical protein